MKRFLKDAGLTLGAFIVLVIIIDMWGLHGENMYSYKRAYMDHHISDIEVLVMGNSLTIHGVDTKVFGPNAWCCALPSRQLYFDKKLLERYLPSMKSCKTVVLPLHYELFAYPRFDTNISTAKYTMYCYYRYFDIKTDTFPWGYLYRSSISANQFSYSAIYAEDFDEAGSALYDRQWDMKYTPTGMHTQYDTERCIAYLTEMAAMLEAKGIRFIVVTPPFTDAYLEGCTVEGERTLQAIADSVNLYHPMEYLNYLRDPDFRSNQFYMNVDHLNAKGATLFAQRIKRDFGL